MNPLDEKIINIKLKQIEDSVKLVEDHLPENYKTFISMDILVRDGIYKRAEFAIQNILDILALMTKYLHKVPGDDEGVIDIILGANLINKETANRLKQMKAFRNFLVHRYGALFEETAYRNIKKGLKDIYRVVPIIKQIIEKLDP